MQASASRVLLGQTRVEGGGGRRVQNDRPKGAKMKYWKFPPSRMILKGYSDKDAVQYREQRLVSTKPPN